MCLSSQNTSSVGVKDNDPGAEEMQSEGRELTVQSNNEEMDDEESECMHVHFF